MSDEETRRRLQHVEDKLDNGRYVRSDLFETVFKNIRDDLVETKEQVKELKSDIALQRREARDNARAIRNMVLGAIFTGIVSILVAVILSFALNT